MNARKRLGKLPRRLLLLTFSTLLTLVLAEAAFRIVHAVHPIFFLPRSDYNQFRARPGSIHIGHPVNAMGFYDREVEARKPEGVYRIVALGDSFAFGVVPYPDNYLTLLEEHLDQGRGKVEVVNMGIPKVGPASYLALLEHEGLRLEPDLVLVNFFTGNDFNLPPEEERSGPRPRSFVAAFFRYLLFIRPQFDGQEYAGADTYDESHPTIREEPYMLVLRRRLYSTFDPRGPRWDEKRHQVHDVFQKIEDLCTARNIPLLVVILPDELQWDLDLRARAFAHFSQLQPERFQFDFPNQALHEILDDLEIPYLDLLPRQRQEPQDVPLYKPQDTHWNRHGNALAARIIADDLRQRGWIP